MKITVRLFASFREATGSPQRIIDIAPGTTVSRLWGDLVREYPRLAPMSTSAAYAINGRYTREDAALNEGDVVAFLPPVSGG